MAKKLSYYDPVIVEWRNEIMREQHSRLLKMIVKRGGDNSNSVERCKGIRHGGSYCREQATHGIYCLNCFKRYNRIRKSCVLKPRRVSYTDIKTR